MTYGEPPSPSDGRSIRPTHPFLAFQKQEVDQSIGQRFEQQVQLHSQRLAVKSGHREMTYHALNQAANRIAHPLLTGSIGAQEPVALLIEEDTALLAAMLGVLKAGRSFVPLDPSFPAQRTLFMLEDSGCRLILTDAKNYTLGARLAGGTRRLLNVEDHDGVDTRAAVENPRAGVAPDAASYILYTSGSTGQPKGVVQNHRVVLHNVMKYTNGFRICAHDRFTLLFSISFGEAMNDIFCALLNGASVFPWHLKEQGVSGLAGWLVEEGITIYHSVPTLFRSFVAQLAGHEEFPQLRVINLGGETVFKSDVELCREHFSPACILVNSLGATETKLIRQYHVDKYTEVTSSVLPAGYEVEDTQVLLLDEAGREVGFDRVGEIAVRSRYLSVGYWRRPDLTEASFLPDPGGGEERLYRTGDLGRMRPDGLLEHLGRKDYQVKIRGHRVEPQEIEATLRQHPALAGAVVLPREDSAGDKRLVAYIVPDRKPAITQGLLRRFLEEQLPGYMVPAAFVMLDALPLTPNGKVDRRALPAPDPSSLRAENAYVAPRNPVEEALAGIWAEVLGVERVGIHDDFFELGGHSLLAAQVTARLCDAFQVELPLRDLFEEPTVAGLAGRIKDLLGDTTWQPAESLGHGRPARLSREFVGSGGSSTRKALPPIQPLARHSAEGGRSAVFPLSFAQQWLWRFEQRRPGNDTVNVAPAAMRLRGPLDVAALEASLGEICARHEALRTTFGTRDGEPVQIVGPPRPVPLAWVDLRELPPTEREAEADRLLRREARRPFDLSRDVMLRATLLCLDDEEHVLLPVMPHLVSDGWSVNYVLFHELWNFYGALRLGERASLPELPFQYADYAGWEQQRLQEGALRRQTEYWKKQLADAPKVLDLPTVRPRRPAQVPIAAQQKLRMPASLLRELHALCRRQNVTLFMTLLAAWATLLHRYSGQDDVLIVTPVANRHRVEVEGLIGFFANPLVLRPDLATDPSFAELLGRVRETAVDAFSHGELPFEKVLEELLPGIRAGFHLRDTPRLSLKLDGLQVERFETDHGTTYLPLMLYMSEGDDGLTARLDYDADLFEVATVTRMLENLRALLESVVADPEQRISKLPLPIKAGGGRRARFGKQLRRAVRRVRRVAGRRLRQSRPR